MPTAAGTSPAQSRTIAAVAVHRLPAADPLAAAARQITPHVRAGTITSMFRSVHRCQTWETAKAPAATSTTTLSTPRGEVHANPSLCGLIPPEPKAVVTRSHTSWPPGALIHVVPLANPGSWTPRPTHAASGSQPARADP